MRESGGGSGSGSGSGVKFFEFVGSVGRKEEGREGRWCGVV